MESQSWMFDLVAADDEVRRRARARHGAAVDDASAALRRLHDLWTEAGYSVPAKRRLAAKLDRANTEHQRLSGQTLFGRLDGLDSEDPLVRARYMPAALLYLVWESRYPHEWHAEASTSCSPWTRKEVLLRGMARRGLPEDAKPHLTNLLIDVLRRPYRCKDWMFGALVRHLADQRFTEKVEPLLDAEDPSTRLRAQFILWVAARPEQRVNRRAWQRWLAADAAK